MFDIENLKNNDFAVYNNFNNLIPEKESNIIIAEYIWIGGNGLIRSKSQTLKLKPKTIKDLPHWNFDGSSTNQASGHNSEVQLIPVKMIKDPFRKGDNIIVLCECMKLKTTKKVTKQNKYSYGYKTEQKEDTSTTSTLIPLKTSRRYYANEIFSRKEIIEEEIWFGIEQEYTMFDSNHHKPLGWPKHGFPRPQGPYYCGNGTTNIYGRLLAESHYKLCLYCGLDISGINSEVMPGQWEYQIGPCIGIDVSDQLWLSRFLLIRLAEYFNIVISFHPKPITGNWNGAGAHTNCSTKSMRQNKNGLELIIKACEKLKVKHEEHMKVYGSDNEKRLTGKYETQNINKFSYGIADRGASIRINKKTFEAGKGYFEDRRPSANMNPYDVTSIIAKTLFDENIKVTIPEKILNRTEESDDDQEN